MSAPVFRRGQCGFTLAELAMVLLITGLLFAMVLKASDMVAQVRIKNLVNDLTGVEAAAALYRDRYRALPGDDATAANRWAGAKSGTGDWIISGRFDDSAPNDPAAMTVNATSGESLAFWWHLRLAGLIHGPGSGPDAARPPRSPAGGVIGVQAAALGLGGPVICVADVTQATAIAVDAQLDDDRPDSGFVRVALSAAGHYTVCRTMRAISVSADQLLVGTIP